MNKIENLWPELAKAACAMVHAHMDNETMVPALDDVAEQFPGQFIGFELSPEYCAIAERRIAQQVLELEAV